MPARNDPTRLEPESASTPPRPGRRAFLLRGSAGIAVAFTAASAGSVWAAGPTGADANQVKLPLIQDPNTEQKEETPDASLPPDDRIGYAIVGLGRLSLN